MLPRLWGRRIVSRALPLVVAFAFEQLGLHRLEAEVDATNEASLRALERIGFTREGLRREREWHDDEARDDVVLGLLERAWRARTP